jgi:hypothetical protein
MASRKTRSEITVAHTNVHRLHAAFPTVETFTRDAVALDHIRMMAEVYNLSDAKLAPGEWPTLRAYADHAHVGRLMAAHALTAKTPEPVDLVTCPFSELQAEMAKDAAALEQTMIDLFGASTPEPENHAPEWMTGSDREQFNDGYTAGKTEPSTVAPDATVDTLNTLIDQTRNDLRDAMELGAFYSAGYWACIIDRLTATRDARTPEPEPEPEPKIETLFASESPEWIAESEQRGYDYAVSIYGDELTIPLDELKDRAASAAASLAIDGPNRGRHLWMKGYARGLADCVAKHTPKPPKPFITRDDAGQIVYRVPEGYTALDRTYQNAAWWQERALEPGDYPFEYTTVDFRPATEETAYWAITRVPGIVTDEDFTPQFCGNAIAPTRKDGVGKPCTHSVQMYGYSVRDAAPAPEPELPPIGGGSQEHAAAPCALITYRTPGYFGLTGTAEQWAETYRRMAAQYGDVAPFSMSETALSLTGRIWQKWQTVANASTQTAYTIDVNRDDAHVIRAANAATDKPRALGFLVTIYSDDPATDAGNRRECDTEAEARDYAARLFATYAEPPYPSIYLTDRATATAHLIHPEPEPAFVCVGCGRNITPAIAGPWLCETCAGQVKKPEIITAPSTIEQPSETWNVYVSRQPGGPPTIWAVTYSRERAEALRDEYVQRPDVFCARCERADAAPAPAPANPDERAATLAEWQQFMEWSGINLNGDIVRNIAEGRYSFTPSHDLISLFLHYDARRDFDHWRAGTFEPMDDLDSVIRRHERAGGFFFRNTKWHRGINYPMVWPMPDGSSLFVTSEKSGHDARRTYSVRQCFQSGRIDTIGEYGEYSTKAKAERVAARIQKEAATAK